MSTQIVSPPLAGRVLYALICGLLCLFLGAFLVGCTGGGVVSPDEECQNNADCKASRGPSFRCVVKGDKRMCELVLGPKACDPACAINQTCVEGKCLDNTALCFGDLDCKPNQTCQNKRCVDKPCTCQTDADCARDGSKSCKDCQCVDKTGPCLCKSNADCPNPGETCQDCSCVLVCRSDADCRAGLKCTNGICKSAPCGCLTDADCPSGNVCRECQCLECATDRDCPVGRSCTGNRCVPSCGCVSDADCPMGTLCRECQCIRENQGRDVGQTCDERSSPCKDGLICLAVEDGTQLCIQRCSSDRDCAANAFRKTCQAFSVRGGQQSFCVGLANKGERCGFAGVGSRQAICPPNGNLICEAGICQERPSGTGKEGESCGNNGQGSTCASDLICLSFSQGGSLNRCHRRCDPNKKGECTYPGTKCLPLLQGGQGICMDDTCTKDSDCAYPNYACRDFPNTGSGKLCFPKEESGPVGFGGLCGQPASTKGCNTDANKGGDPNLFCLVANQQGSDGYCSYICTQTNTCPKYVTKDGRAIQATCVQIGQDGSKACLFPCGQPGQTCPDNLTCQNVGQQVCLAP